jgi:hypothetical protein
VTFVILAALSAAVVLLIHAASESELDRKYRRMRRNLRSSLGRRS